MTSIAASRNSHFRRLGLTDAALLEAVSRETPLVTVDLDLYRAATHRDPHSAFNYWHVHNALRIRAKPGSGERALLESVQNHLRGEGVAPTAQESFL